MPIPNRIILLGPMGSGKSAVGKKLASLLGWSFVDTDAIVEQKTGVDIAYIFEKEGESGFRNREHSALREAAARDNHVIATGGGIVSQPQNRTLLAAAGCIVYLQTSVRQQYERTRHSNKRPLLHTENPLAELQKLLDSRAPWFQKLATITVNTDGRRVNGVARQIQSKIEQMSMATTAAGEALKVDLGVRSYPIYIQQGLLNDDLFWAQNKLADSMPQQLMIVSDENVAPRYMESLCGHLQDKTIHHCILKAGEKNKNADSFKQILDQLVERGFQRDAAVIALGGGVVGDISGYAAASFMRGIDFYQVPTTLLAQVDSSVGGKTGINHPQGKNLIGAFHQPRAVFIDTATLTTLDDRELKAGLAEVIKYGCIYDAEFFDWLEKSMPALLALDPEALNYAIRRSCEIKARIVEQDEQEKGCRAWLNFGHSFGHALEQTTQYQRWLHGEAVAIGMLMAAHLSLAMGQLENTELDRIEKLISATGLPVNAGQASIDELLHAMRKDKKNTTTAQRLIVLRGIGSCELRDDCPAELVSAAVGAYLDSQV